MTTPIGQAAVAQKGWWLSHRFLLLRRLCQLTVLALFLLGPLAGIWVLKGNLAASVLLDTIPLSDPLVWLQTLLAGKALELSLGLGALLVAGIYLVLGGRVFCSWVCPVNPVTDAASWLRRRLGLNRSGTLSRSLRYWMLGMVLALPLVTGALVWELVNPVSLTMRGLLYGMGAGWGLIVAIFAFDLFMVRRGWCGHLCPLGAFYALLGRLSPLRINASQRSRCNDCMDCYALCPEPQVIKPALKGEPLGNSSLILAPECTNCGRCIDVCSESVFEFSTRFANKAERPS
ncbi:quinol dehydrogenase ferredoxin subunit NapH [Aestuariirhabdus litorea]|uniref:Quinol dehydrogenase ferredoxin subunit NapH n=1 Tax=Aestuariirhabdus litorea TaxID=2528527 RepID=A0A3P3VPM4_9GAMM|nr:quinol dehydrogenase ferredoxin subunit NapH [Aestuariirhabdus litorea]RRJ83868.1 quinol dehydrogenase ferredoxin subunit NapH [Aestuariirhabdus litorea]RWW97091.1 quinol dehydrogenase ferredoxin subunit NapH [Endozoicomonadaceae bacterium GTF-13]